MKWISVKDRLPEETGRYWCYVKEYNDLGISHFQWNFAFNVEEQGFNTNETEKVTHWMPLPDPPTN